MRQIPGIRLWLLLVIVSGTLSPLDAQKPEPNPAAKAVAPTAPTASPVEPGLAVEQQWAIVTRYTSADQSSVVTTYISGERQRVQVNASSAVVTQCDARQILQIDERAKAYATVPLAVRAFDAASAAGRVIVRTVVTDTGERRDMYGYEARRLRITTTAEPEGQGCEAKKSRTESDGWYVDVPDLQVCALMPVRDTHATAACSEHSPSEGADSVHAGYPMAYTTVTYDASNKEVSRISAEVSSLTRGPRSEALFEPPAEFVQLPDVEALATAARRAELEALGTTPKAAGMIRIGVALPTDVSGRQVDREAFGNEVLEAFSDSPFEAVPIDATDARGQVEEATAKECDFLLRVELAELTTSKPGRIGGLARRATGGGNPAELHEAKINVELNAVGRDTAARKQTATAKTGSFTWRRAVGLTRFAGRLYFGMTAGIMNAALTASSGGSTSLGDPTLNALSMLLPPERADEEQHSPEAVLVAAIERAATDLKRSIVPPK